MKQIKQQKQVNFVLELVTRSIEKKNCKNQLISGVAVCKWHKIEKASLSKGFILLVGFNDEISNHFPEEIRVIADLNTFLKF